MTEWRVIPDGDHEAGQSEPPRKRRTVESRIEVHTVFVDGRQPPHGSEVVIKAVADAWRPFGAPAIQCLIDDMPPGMCD